MQEMAGKFLNCAILGDADDPILHTMENPTLHTMSKPIQHNMENLIRFAQQSKSYTLEICTAVQILYILL